MNSRLRGQHWLPWYDVTMQCNHYCNDGTGKSKPVKKNNDVS